MSNKRRLKQRPRSKARKKPLAESADRHALYQESVQCPEADIEFFVDTYRKHRRRQPWVLREDFCGTAYLGVEWCKSHPRRRATVVDLCRDTLEWGRKHNVLPAGPRIADALNLIRGDVLTAKSEKADITCALNFSYCVFKSRDTLRRYLRSARRGLKSTGMLILDVYGGTEAVIANEEEREVGGFTYIWEQERYDPISHGTTCHIHFGFPDGSRLERAFTYDWRLWTIPELRELLEEAGFARSTVYWEEVEEDGDSELLEGTGRYVAVTETENQEGWLAYIVAED